MDRMVIIDEKGTTANDHPITGSPWWTRSWSHSLAKYNTIFLDTPKNIETHPYRIRIDKATGSYTYSFGLWDYKESRFIVQYGSFVGDPAEDARISAAPQKILDANTLLIPTELIKPGRAYGIFDARGDGVIKFYPFLMSVPDDNNFTPLPIVGPSPSPPHTPAPPNMTPAPESKIIEIDTSSTKDMPGFVKSGIRKGAQLLGWTVTTIQRKGRTHQIYVMRNQ